MKRSIVVSPLVSPFTTFYTPHAGSPPPSAETIFVPSVNLLRFFSMITPTFNLLPSLQTSNKPCTQSSSAQSSSANQTPHTSCLPSSRDSRNGIDDHDTLESDQSEHKAPTAAATPSDNQRGDDAETIDSNVSENADIHDQQLFQQLLSVYNEYSQHSFPSSLASTYTSAEPPFMSGAAGGASKPNSNSGDIEDGCLPLAYGKGNQFLANFYYLLARGDHQSILVPPQSLFRQTMMPSSIYHESYIFQHQQQQHRHHQQQHGRPSSQSVQICPPSRHFPLQKPTLDTTTITTTMFSREALENSVFNCNPLQPHAYSVSLESYLNIISPKYLCDRLFAYFNQQRQQQQQQQQQAILQSTRLTSIPAPGGQSIALLPGVPPGAPPGASAAGISPLIRSAFPPRPGDDSLSMTSSKQTGQVPESVSTSGSPTVSNRHILPPPPPQSRTDGGMHGMESPQSYAVSTQSIGDHHHHQQQPVSTTTHHHQQVQLERLELPESSIDGHESTTTTTTTHSRALLDSAHPHPHAQSPQPSPYSPHPPTHISHTSSTMRHDLSFHGPSTVPTSPLSLADLEYVQQYNLSFMDPNQPVPSSSGAYRAASSTTSALTTAPDMITGTDGSGTALGGGAVDMGNGAQSVHVDTGDDDRGSIATSTIQQQQQQQQQQFKNSRKSSTVSMPAEPRTSLVKHKPLQRSDCISATDSDNEENENSRDRDDDARGHGGDDDVDSDADADADEQQPVDAMMMSQRHAPSQQGDLHDHKEKQDEENRQEQEQNEVDNTQQQLPPTQNINTFTYTLSTLMSFYTYPYGIAIPFQPYTVDFIPHLSAICLYPSRSLIQKHATQQLLPADAHATLRLPGPLHPDEPLVEYYERAAFSMRLSFATSWAKLTSIHRYLPTLTNQDINLATSWFSVYWTPIHATPQVGAVFPGKIITFHGLELVGPSPLLPPRHFGQHSYIAHQYRLSQSQANAQQQYGGSRYPPLPVSTEDHNNESIAPLDHVCSLCAYRTLSVQNQQTLLTSACPESALTTPDQFVRDNDDNSTVQPSSTRKTGERQYGQHLSQYQPTSTHLNTPSAFQPPIIACVPLLGYMCLHVRASTWFRLSSTKSSLPYGATTPLDRLREKLLQTPPRVHIQRPIASHGLLQMDTPLPLTSMPITVNTLQSTPNHHHNQYCRFMNASNPNTASQKCYCFMFYVKQYHQLMQQMYHHCKSFSDQFKRSMLARRQVVPQSRIPSTTTAITTTTAVAASNVDKVHTSLSDAVSANQSGHLSTASRSGAQSNTTGSRAGGAGAVGLNLSSISSYDELLSDNSFIIRYNDIVKCLELSSHSSSSSFANYLQQIASSFNPLNYQRLLPPLPQTSQYIYEKEVYDQVMRLHASSLVSRQQKPALPVNHENDDMTAVDQTQGTRETHNSNTTSDATENEHVGEVTSTDDAATSVDNNTTSSSTLAPGNESFESTTATTTQQHQQREPDGEDTDYPHSSSRPPYEPNNNQLSLQQYYNLVRQSKISCPYAPYDHIPQVERMHGYITPEPSGGSGAGGAGGQIGGVGGGLGSKSHTNTTSYQFNSTNHTHFVPGQHVRQPGGIPPYEPLASDRLFWSEFHPYLQSIMDAPNNPHFDVTTALRSAYQ